MGKEIVSKGLVFVIIGLFIGAGVTITPNIFIKTVKGLTVPSGIIYSVPITLTNSQSSATSTPFEQMITVNSAAYSSYEAFNLQNMEFFYEDGTIIPSWMESGDNTATSTVYWLKLAGGIAAESSLTVYMGFASLSTNLFNSIRTGEAPDLSPSYGEYDDGANVFTYYWNFPGPNLPSGWAFSQAVPIGGYSVNAGASFFTGNGTANAIYGYYTAPLESSSYLLSTRMESYSGGNNGEGVWIGWWSDPQSPLASGSYNSANTPYNGNYVSDWIWCPNFNPVQPIRVISNGGTTPAALPGGGYPPGCTLFDATQLMTYRLSWLGNNQTAMLRTATGGVGVASQIASLPPQGNYYLGFYDNTAGWGNNGETAQWVAVSAMPPSGVTPSVSFSSTSDSIGLSTPAINGLTVDFNGGASPGNQVTYIQWNWGDGSVDNGWFPHSHTYTSSGTYSVTVTAHYNDGSTASTSTSLNVFPGEMTGGNKLTISAGQGGSVSYTASVSSGTVQPGQPKMLYLAYADGLSLTADPSSGQSFSSWTTSTGITLQGSATPTSPSIGIVVTSDSNITANFIQAPFHDVAVLDIIPQQRYVVAEESLPVSVIVQNLGTQTESFSVTAYCGTSKIGFDVKDVTLNAGETQTLQMLWNITEIFPGIYQIGAYATPVPGEVKLSNNDHTNGTVTVAVSTRWNLAENPYSQSYQGSDWSKGGNCYGLSSTAILYFMHYKLHDLTFPSFPAQNPPATSTSELKLPNQASILNNVSLSVMFHQVYDPAHDWGAGYSPETEYEKLVIALESGTPALLGLASPLPSYHAVVAYSIQPLQDGTMNIALSDPNYPQQWEIANYNPSTQTFLYNSYNRFKVKTPGVIQSSWDHPTDIYIPQSQTWEWQVTNYTIVLAGKPVKLMNPSIGGMLFMDYFNSPGDSGSLVCGIPGSSGIEEGSVQIYAIPCKNLWYVEDPLSDQSTIMISRVENVSGQNEYFEYIVNATSKEGPISDIVIPRNDSLAIIALNGTLNANVTFFYATRQNYSILQMSNISVGVKQKFNFTVSNWQMLNNTNPPTVTLKISPVDVPPTTTLIIGKPKYVSSSGNIYVSSATPFVLSAKDNLGGIGIASILYRIYNNGVWMNWIRYTQNFTLSGEGKHYLEYYSVDNLGNVEITHNQTHYVDNTPPVTTNSLSGTLGKNNWYISNVGVILSAYDSLSGLNKTNYRVDNGSWQTYTNTFTLSSDRTHVINYYSTDMLGNKENMKSVTIKIDKTPPTILVTKPEAGFLYICDNKIANVGQTIAIGGITVKISTSDTISGIAKVEFYVDNKIKATVTTSPYQWKWTEKIYCKHQLKIISYDQAGNTKTIVMDIWVYNC